MPYMQLTIYVVLKNYFRKRQNMNFGDDEFLNKRWNEVLHFATYISAIGLAAVVKSNFW